MTIKRKIFFLIALLDVFLAWSISYGMGVFDPLWLAIFLALIVYVGLYWIVNFEVNTLGFVSVLGPPALLTMVGSYMVQSGFSGYMPGSGVYLGVSLAIFSGLMYVSLATANIINTWTFKRVALAQVASTVFLFLSLISFYFSLLAIVSYVGQFVVAVVLASIVGAFLYFCNMWLAEATSEESIRATVILTVLLGFFALVLFFWPVPVEMYSAALASVFFISTGITIHAKKKTLTFWVWVEYMVVLALVVTFLVNTARWGIAGRI